MRNDRDAVGNRIFAALKGFSHQLFTDNFDGLFILFTLLAIGVILNLLDHKLSYLSFFYIPVLLAGYYKSTRSAVLGALFSVSWVGFFVVIDPSSFTHDMDSVRLYFHILVWGAFLVMTGAIVGSLSEQMRARHQRLCDTMDDINQLKDYIIEKNRFLEFKNQRLESTRERLESVVNSAIDPFIAKLISEQKSCSERRQVSVLCADLPDFMANGENRAPGAVIGDLDWFFSTMDPVLTHFRGHLDKFEDGGLVAEFGAPHPAPNHPLLAALAGLWMQRRMEYHRFPWKLRVGIASGSALVGLMGSAHRKSYTAIGGAVNRAARLRSLCPSGGVCVDAGVHDLVGRWFHTRPVRTGPDPSGPRLAAGRKGVDVQSSITAYEILGLKDFLEVGERIPAAVAQAFERNCPEAELSEELMLSIEACDGSLGHGQVCAALCAALAHGLGMDETQVRTAFLAGYYHDVGRKTIPPHLLDCEERLAQLPQPDQDAIKSHVAAAVKVLPEIGGPDEPEVAEVILEHHERFDGRGYPKGLSGTGINVLARILQFANAYEVLTAWRAYKQPWSADEALGQIERGIAEGEFDPKIGEVFLKLMRPAG